jgi:serine/threonine protein kinase
MAEIFLARAATAAGVARFVVLKRVLQEKASDLQFLRMFLDEARLAAQLQHPNIAQVYDVGRLGDSYFFTMEYVHGVTLRELMQELRGQPMPTGAVLAIAAGAAAGLHHAHERIGVDGQPLGIVHRDISPSNLMVSFEGHVKVVDFGIAKATTRSQETHSGTVRGKISYLSPEQAVGGAIDRRSDVFSLGIVMWEMLTGLRLYKRDSDYASMAAVVEEPVPALPADAPPALVLLVMRALAKRPEERFQTAQQMLEAIENVAANINSPLSSAALSRFVLSLFGQRPEPWAGLMQQPGARNIVTVNAEPLPRELVIPPRGEIDRQLSAVHDFTSTGIPVDPMELRPTLMLPPSPAMMLPPADPATRGSGVSGVIPSRRGMSPLWIGAISFALAIALALGARVYLRNRRQTQPAAVLADAQSIAMTEVDAGAESPAIPTVDVDASVGEATAPQDATVATTPARPDAAVEIHKPNNPDRPDRPDRPRPPRPRPPDDHGEGKSTNEWPAFATCASTNAAKNAQNCVEIACRLHEAGKARKWLAKVPESKVQGVIAVCKIEGVELEDSKLPDRVRSD